MTDSPYIKFRANPKDKEKLDTVQKMLKRKTMSDTIRYLINLAHRRLTED